MLSDLATRAKAGDRAAFAELAEAVAGRLTATARLILRDETATQDAVQEALVDAWRDIRGLRDPDRTEAWIYRILVNACRERARRDRRRALMEVPAYVGMVPERSSSTVRAPDLETRDQVERALARLPTDLRAVLVLTYYVDLPMAEAATALSIPLGTMKSRLNRARSALRAAIEAEERPTALVAGSPS